MLFLRGGQPIIITTMVSKFKLILFVTQQVDKLRDELLGQRIATLLDSWQKMVDVCLKEPVLPELDSGFFSTKRGGSKVKHFLVPVSHWSL